MTMRRFLPAITIVWLVVVSACGAGDEPAVDTTAQTAPTAGVGSTADTDVSTSTSSVPADGSSTTTTTSEPTPGPIESAMAAGCRGLDQTPVGRELTFAAQGHVFVAGRAGIRCLARTDEPTTTALAWAPTADRFMTGDGAVFAEGGPISPPQDDVTGSATWTRPTGASIIYTNTAGLLTKASVDGSSTAHLAPLRTHDAIAYHPDGLTFAVSGELDDQYGLWISRNDGTDPQVLAFGSDVRITEIVFTPDASWLYFVADHGDAWHVHAIFLETFEFDEGELGLSTVFEENFEPVIQHTRPITGLVADTNGELGRIAHTVGSCEDAEVEIAIEREDGTWLVTGTSGTRPIGFLDGEGPDDVALAYAESAGSCDETARLHTWQMDEFGAVTDSQIDDVVAEAAAIRFIPPAPVYTLHDVHIEGFA